MVAGILALQSQAEQLPWSMENETILMEPYSYLAAIPGKDIRTRLLLSLNAWYSVPEPALMMISDIVTILHHASLLFDDIEDSSELRRGHPVAHKVYGLPRTINTAAYSCYVAMQKIMDLHSITGIDQLRLQKIFLEEIVELHRGQGLELYWRETLTCPTEEEYFSMVKQKTGGLFRLGVRLMAACSTSKTKECTNVVNLLSILFQIRDDVLNIDCDQYAAKKGFAEDLTEGKFSFPVIHSITANPSEPLVTSILAKHTNDLNLKLELINYMRHCTKSIQYSRRVIRSVEQELIGEIEYMGGNEKLMRIVHLLHIN
ncbi:terpenoid synthase [Flagelloscypha sp. PMI_526]|nr:terpenoid synthase [Flagelloscypha sp. PMI_526]